MKNWNHSKLSSVISMMESGSRPKGGASTESGVIPSLGGENILKYGGVTLEKLKRVPQKFFEKMSKGKLQHNDILINKDGAQTGKVGLYTCIKNESACINEHLFIIRSNNEKINQEYLYYVLLSPTCQNQIEIQISGSAQPGLKSNFLDNVFTTLPKDLYEQSKITEVLSIVDKAIEQTEALIAKQQRIKTGLMQDLLTKGIDEQGNLRSEETHEFKDSLLGRIPVEWEIAPIKKYSPLKYPYLKTGPFGSSLNTKHWVQYGTPVLTIGSLGESIILSSELLFTSKNTANKLSGFKVKAGDIVFSRVADIGRSFVITSEYAGAIISSNLMRISLNMQAVSPDYLHKNIAYNSRIKKQLRQTSNSGGRELVNSPILNSLLFSWPLLKEQKKVDEQLNVLKENINHAKKSIRKLYSIRTALMQDLLTGKVRVTPLIDKEINP